MSNTESKESNIDKAREVYGRSEAEHWATIERLTREKNIPMSEVLINFPAFIRRREMPRMLADYELFKQIKDLPGSIVELGVYLGAGLFTWSKMLETFVPGDRSRKAFGFEAGEGYTKFDKEDQAPQEWIDKAVGEKKISVDFLEEMVKLHNDDNLIPGVERCRVIKGDINETVPKFAENRQGMRLSLIYFDVNLFEPTYTALEHLYPLLLTGGIVAFNGYGCPPWEGEGTAIEKYFTEKLGKVPRMKKFPWSIHPSAYFVKGEE